MSSSEGKVDLTPEQIADFLNSMEEVLNSKEWKPDLDAFVTGYIGGARMVLRHVEA